MLKRSCEHRPSRRGYDPALIIIIVRLNDIVNRPTHTDHKDVGWYPMSLWLIAVGQRGKSVLALPPAVDLPLGWRSFCGPNRDFEDLLKDYNGKLVFRR